ncbi:MAG: hypothetical protein IJ243_04945 [Prevotella sp.]|nr:hypothetical protein [Prevotella sp.]
MLAAEKKPFLGGLRKWLAHSVFCSKQKKYGGRWLEKVNAAEKFGVDFFRKSVRSEVKKTTKFSK